MGAGHDARQLLLPVFIIGDKPKVGALLRPWRTPCQPPAYRPDGPLCPPATALTQPPHLQGHRVHHTFILHARQRAHHCSVRPVPVHLFPFTCSVFHPAQRGNNPAVPAALLARAGLTRYFLPRRALLTIVTAQTTVAPSKIAAAMQMSTMAHTGSGWPLEPGMFLLAAAHCAAVS